MCLTRAADIVRNDLFAKFPAFNDHFDSNYVHAPVPKSLLCLVRMLLEGPHFMKNCPVDAGCDNTDNGDVAVNVAQLIRYNSTEKMCDGGERRHSLDRETPLPVYVGLLLHTKMRNDGLVNKLSCLGLCISYDRVCDIKESIASHLCKGYEERKLVQMASIKDGLISLFQHPDQNALANAITIAAFLLLNPKRDFFIRFQINCSISENPEMDYNPNNLPLEVDYSDSIIN